jgi:hypothetical protein
MSDPILTTTVKSKLPDILHPLFSRLAQQAMNERILQGLPIGDATPQEYLILPDGAADAWIEATTTQLSSLLNIKVVPAALAPLIDGPLLTAMLAPPARTGAPKSAGKARTKPQEDPPTVNAALPGLTGTPDEPAA